MTPNTPLSEFPGIGPARARALRRLGLATAGDLLNYFPRDYEDRTRIYSIAEAPEDLPACISAVVAEIPRAAHIRRGLDIVRTRVVDNSRELQLTFFNQNYVRGALEVGGEYIFYGRLEREGKRARMVNPLFERADRTRFTGRIMPRYRLTAGISNHLLVGLVERALPDCAGAMPSVLPEKLRHAHGLPPLGICYERIHFPKTQEDVASARRSFIFEELLTLAAGMTLLRKRRCSGSGPVFRAEALPGFYRLLPFLLTGAQRRAITEAALDMASGRPMNRLVQGDVGSGKTVVAAACAFLCVKSGWQCAMMAPTELLARQHADTLNGLLAPVGVTVGLLTGSQKASEKKKRYAELKAGSLPFVVGTHALLSQGVAFARLGLVITDEQHRFGVDQRSALAAKGEHPHLLVMSATPIPRTLALMIYGDLDLSVIDELPPGRKPVNTVLIRESKRRRMYGFVREQVCAGRQAYIVCPTVERGEAERESPLHSATEYAEILQREVFPDLRVGLVHGRMKPGEKQAAMAAFVSGRTDILVATTVVEVGVDVPNATLMIVENAERYGLSQLHQLRGRVGRGSWQSWCILVSDARNPDTRARLKVLTETTDGFRIAEEDLKLRGPGDFFGARQHGLPTLKAADLNTDTQVLAEAHRAAHILLEEDPGLVWPEHQPLREGVRRLFEQNQDSLN